MAEVYLHDPNLGIHYQEDKNLKLWLVKLKNNGLVFFAGTEEEIDEYEEDNSKKIEVIYAFSELLLDYINIVGSTDTLPKMPLEKYVQAGEQVL